MVIRLFMCPELLFLLEEITRLHGYQVYYIFRVLHNNKNWFMSVGLQRFKDIECSRFWPPDSPHF